MKPKALVQVVDRPRAGHADEAGYANWDNDKRYKNLAPYKKSHFMQIANLDIIPVRIMATMLMVQGWSNLYPYVQPEAYLNIKYRKYVQESTRWRLGN